MHFGATFSFFAASLFGISPILLTFCIKYNHSPAYKMKTKNLATGSVCRIFLALA